MMKSQSMLGIVVILAVAFLLPPSATAWEWLNGGDEDCSVPGTCCERFYCCTDPGTFKNCFLCEAPRLKQGDEAGPGVLYDVSSIREGTKEEPWLGFYFKAFGDKQNPGVCPEGYSDCTKAIVDAGLCQ